MSADKPISTLQIEVKAKQLFKAQLNLKGEKLQDKIDQFTNLTTNEGLGSSYGNKNKNQSTDIFLGAIMTWSIVISKEKGDEEYVVVLDSIEQPDTGFFTKIEKGTGENKGKLIGHVTSNPEFIDKGENYIINFHITKGDETSIVLPIDPRLRVRQ